MDIYETGIGVEETEIALKGTKSGKATGPSNVSVDNVMIQCMDRESLAQVARYFNIILRSRREVMTFQPRLTELALPSVVCRYMDDVYLPVAYQNNDQLEKKHRLSDV